MNKTIKGIMTILVVVMLLGALVLTACDTGGGGGGGGGSNRPGGGGSTSGIDGMGLSKTTPNNTVLSGSGIDATQYNTFLNAGGGGYEGWKEGSLIMVWSGRSKSNFDNVLSALGTAINPSNVDNFNSPTFHGVYWAAHNKAGTQEYRYQLTFGNDTSFKELDIEFPAGSMVLILYK